MKIRTNSAILALVAAVALLTTYTSTSAIPRHNNSVNPEIPIPLEAQRLNKLEKVLNALKSDKPKDLLAMLNDGHQKLGLNDVIQFRARIAKSWPNLNGLKHVPDLDVKVNTEFLAHWRIPVHKQDEVSMLFSSANRMDNYLRIVLLFEKGGFKITGFCVQQEIPSAVLDQIEGVER